MTQHATTPAASPSVDSPASDSESSAPIAPVDLGTVYALAALRNRSRAVPKRFLHHRTGSSATA